MYYGLLAFACLLSVAECVFLIWSIVAVFQCSVSANGTVSDITTIHSGEKGLLGKRPYTRYLVNYAYQFNGGQYHMHGISRVRTPQCNVGDSEEIMFDPKNPSKAYSWFDREQIIGNHISALIILVLVGLLMYYIG